jgi:hypothetical protein
MSDKEGTFAFCRMKAAAEKIIHYLLLKRLA